MWHSTASTLICQPEAQELLSCRAGVLQTLNHDQSLSGISSSLAVESGRALLRPRSKRKSACPRPGAAGAGCARRLGIPPDLTCYVNSSALPFISE